MYRYYARHTTNILMRPRLRVHLSVYSDTSNAIYVQQQTNYSCIYQQVQSVVRTSPCIAEYHMFYGTHSPLLYSGNTFTIYGMLCYAYSRGITLYRKGVGFLGMHIWIRYVTTSICLLLRTIQNTIPCRKGVRINYVPCT